MKKVSNPDHTRKRYNRLAFFYDFLEVPIERFCFAAWRSRLRNRIVGNHVLEVGVGTGKNLLYYPQEVKMNAIDFSRRMLKRARRRASALGSAVVFQEMDIQQLAFPDHCFETVFATFVFCSVPDPVVGLKELQRVCKRDGRLLLLEHMRPSSPLLGFFFDLFNPVVVRIIGANINRNTIDNIRKAGWKILHEERLLSDIVRWIEAEPI